MIAHFDHEQGQGRAPEAPETQAPAPAPSADATTGLRFPLGRCVITAGALATMDGDPSPGISMIRRHAAGDWGNLGPEDKQANEDAIAYGDRILSAYHVGFNGGPPVKFYVITEADRSATTVLRADEY